MLGMHDHSERRRRGHGLQENLFLASAVAMYTAKESAKVISKLSSGGAVVVGANDDGTEGVVRLSSRVAIVPGLIILAISSNCMASIISTFYF
jgi:hypothetical protein